MNKDWVDKDYYQVLGVSPTADQDAIKRAYRKLAQEHHPDANPDKPEAEERFKDISEAYATLSHADERKQYDEVRQMVASGGFSGFGSASNPFGGAGGPGGQRVRVEDLGDLLGGFGGLGDLFGGGRRQQQSGPRRGQDIQASLHLSFEDAVRGVTTTLAVDGEASCHVCNGSGAEPGTRIDVCPSCGGSGTISQNQGVFSFAQPCRQCKGSGRMVREPCKNCRGAGTEVRTRKINAKIPPGVQDGATIRLRGKGGPGSAGGPAGDLLVRTQVAKHPIFGRKGDHLTATIPVTFTEAALGAEIDVPTLNGSVRLKVPSGTTSGKTFRVREKGVPRTKGKPGDLLVTVHVEVPKKLSRGARKLLEQYRAEFETDSPRSTMGV
ncbi:MAG: molecular chaperone DnaJ [Acidimicrobiia bacterium]|nr:molecular chaperone DnaJ [Acidimicrobiia bacterium]